MKPRVLNYSGSVLICMVFFGTGVVASGEELITDGDFASLGTWGEIAEGMSREQTQENSPFAKKQPDNGRSVLLSGRGRMPHLIQTINAPVTSGKVEFSMDFKINGAVSEEGVSGWGVGLFDGINPAKSSAGFSASTRFRLQNDTGAGGRILLRSKFEPETWYHFSATLDLGTGKWSGVLVDDIGNEEEFFDEPFGDAQAGPVEIGGVRISPQGGHVSDATPVPLLVDNISLRVLEE
jgi:hypothetical protein